ncbi:MAG: type II toxin-antitoxin system YafQ family toxin [Moraxellaceae bacterium]|nr:type II toxin-antitoxin system YafQ family toxin [Moraxellaceae bacterium]
MNKQRRKIYATKSFKRDLKKRYEELLTPEWLEVIDCLTMNIKLPEKYLDHGLTGNLVGLRDCHVKNDLVLIYKINDDDILELHQLNSHAKVFG